MSPVPDEIRSEEIKAYAQLMRRVTPTSVSPDALAAFCASRLAAYKVPRWSRFRLTDFAPPSSRRIQKEEVKGERCDLTAGVGDRERVRGH